MSSEPAKSFIKLIERGLKEHFIGPAKHRVRVGLARAYRSILEVSGGVRFIGVTGSCAKTTTTELIAAILAREGGVRKASHENTIAVFTKTILSISAGDRFCICEMSAAVPGQMRKSAALLKPHIGVVTNIGQDHYGSYRDPALTAAEKGMLVESLPADGVAVLNADDPYVYAMRERTRARVITYGLSSDAAVRGENVFCAWPRRLSLDVCHSKNHVHVQTQLLGEHWAHAVLAAASATIAAGVSLEHAAEVIESFEPVPYRMCPHEMADGVTFICDSWKASLWTIPSTLDFMRKARAKRKVMVVGAISDTPKSFYRRYKSVTQQAADTFDMMLFVGDHSHTALRARPQNEADRIMAFETLCELNCFLRTYLKPGDLVMLKGTAPADHLERIVLDRTSDIACWRQNCGKHRFCTDCPLLHAASLQPDASLGAGLS